MKTALIAGLILTIAATQAQAQTVTLYDGSRNTSFSTQGWSVLVPPGSETVSSGGTTLNTTASDSLRGGYSLFSQLNRTQGYTLGFNLQLLSELHRSRDRAGFSIIVLSSDRQGIELGFWANDTQSNDRIWAQNDGVTKPPRFTHAEGTAFNPAKSIVRYDLSVKGDRYGLFASRNFQAPILTGKLRNYSAEGTVYNLPNFIFLGDNTTSAKGAVRITRVDLSRSAIPFSSIATRARIASASTPAPEPVTILGSGAAIVIAGILQRKRR